MVIWLMVDGSDGVACHQPSTINYQLFCKRHCAGGEADPPPPWLLPVPNLNLWASGSQRDFRVAPAKELHQIGILGVVVPIHMTPKRIYHGIDFMLWNKIVTPTHAIMPRCRRAGLLLDGLQNPQVEILAENVVHRPAHRQRQS
jgi:hypothetical protein